MIDQLEFHNAILSHELSIFNMAHLELWTERGDAMMRWKRSIGSEIDQTIRDQTDRKLVRKIIQQRNIFRKHLIKVIFLKCSFLTLI